MNPQYSNVADQKKMTSNYGAKGPSKLHIKKKNNNGLMARGNTIDNRYISAQQ
jgi:hypothetical protein